MIGQLLRSYQLTTLYNLFKSLFQNHLHTLNLASPVAKHGLPALIWASHCPRKAPG